MSKRNMRTRVLRMLTTVAIGGSVFQLSGCDPAVRQTLLDGLETTTTSLSSALISAYFLSLDNTDSSSLTTT